MFKVTQPTTPSRTSGRWLQDYSDRAALLPNGITLDPAQWTADSDGYKIVLSGALVGRKGSEVLFGPVADDDTEVYFIWKDTNITIEGNITEVVRRGAIFDGLLPAMPSDTIKTLLKGRGFQFIPYSGAGIDE